MKHLFRRAGQLAFSFILAGVLLAQDHWVATWGASPQAARGPLPAPPQAAAAAAPQPAPAPPPGAQFQDGFHNQTVRMIVHTSIGGRRVRVQLSNAFGNAPLRVGVAHVAIRSKDSEIVPASDRTLAFNGKPAAVIPPGALLLSDPVDVDVPQQSDLAISLYLPDETGPPTIHNLGLHTIYVAKGDAASQPSLPDAATIQSLYWLSSVDVLAPANAAALVTFGDSITDGARSTPDTNSGWPSLLAQRFLANRGTANIAVVNEGIAGNRVLQDGQGVSALARFDRDVLGQAGVKWITVLEGINDIGTRTRAGTPASEALSLPDGLIAGLAQIAERAHTHGIKVIGCTLTPYQGAVYYSEKGESFRQNVNRWIRTSGVFDSIADFDAATRDPNDPAHIRADFDSGDHLHPSDAGYKAMADAIDLSIFEPAVPAKNTSSR